MSKAQKSTELECGYLPQTDRRFVENGGGYYQVHSCTYTYSMVYKLEFGAKQWDKLHRPSNCFYEVFLVKTYLPKYAFNEENSWLPLRHRDCV